MSRFRSSLESAAGYRSELRKHKGHQQSWLARVIQIKKFACDQAARRGEFLDHHTRRAQIAHIHAARLGCMRASPKFAGAADIELAGLHHPRSS